MNSELRFVVSSCSWCFEQISSQFCGLLAPHTWEIFVTWRSKICLQLRRQEHPELESLFTGVCWFICPVFSWQPQTKTGHKWHQNCYSSHKRKNPFSSFISPLLSVTTQHVTFLSWETVPPPISSQLQKASEQHITLLPDPRFWVGNGLLPSTVCRHYL